MMVATAVPFTRSLARRSCALVHRDFLSDVELRGAVVCQQGDRSGQEDKSDAESPQKSISHCDCLQGAPSLPARNFADKAFAG